MTTHTENFDARTAPAAEVEARLSQFTRDATQRHWRARTAETISALQAEAAPAASVEHAEPECRKINGRAPAPALARVQNTFDARNASDAEVEERLGQLIGNGGSRSRSHTMER